MWPPCAACLMCKWAVKGCVLLSCWCSCKHTCTRAHTDRQRQAHDNACPFNCALKVRPGQKNDCLHSWGGYMSNMLFWCGWLVPDVSLDSSFNYINTTHAQMLLLQFPVIKRGIQRIPNISVLLKIIRKGGKIKHPPMQGMSFWFCRHRHRFAWNRLISLTYLLSQSAPFEGALQCCQLKQKLIREAA